MALWMHVASRLIGAFVVILSLISIAVHLQSAPRSWFDPFRDMVVGQKFTRSCDYFDVPMMYTGGHKYCMNETPEATIYITVDMDNLIQSVSFTPRKMVLAQIIQEWGAPRLQYRRYAAWYSYCWRKRGYAYAFRQNIYSLYTPVNFFSYNNYNIC